MANEMNMKNTPMLRVSDLEVYYGAIHALKGLSLEVNEGEIVTLIGANGAGKSTTLRTISGLIAPRGGSIEFEGKNIAGTGAHEIVRAGISQVPEGRRIFAEMSVLENLELGAFTRSDKDGIAADMEMVFTRFPRLKERIAQQAGTLSGGEQQRVAIARALIGHPELILADEPTGNLDPAISLGIMKLLDLINRTGTTVVMATHDREMVDSMRKRVIALEAGHIVRDQEKGGYGFYGSV